jgi:hypothetical protein
VEDLFVDESSAPRLVAEGELWTEPVTATIERDRKSEKLWSALVFGSPVLWDLTEPEMMTLAMKGRAVSPVTSYLAIEPGVRPSTEGIDWGSTGQGFGAGSGRLGGSHRTSRPPRPLDREAFLSESIAKDWRRCGGRPGGASVTLETTVAEIVTVSSVSLVEKDALLERCLREAVWELILPVSFTGEWETFTIKV